MVESRACPDASMPVEKARPMTPSGGDESIFLACFQIDHTELVSPDHGRMNTSCDAKLW
jgi:hypothetical protein